MGYVVGVSAYFKWCCGRGDVLRILVLLMVGLSLGLIVDFRFPGVMLSRVVSLSVLVTRGGLGHCCLWMCVLCGWRFVSAYL